MKKVLAIIPARGGSKRIKKKNIKPFLGKPIILWVIDKLNKINIFDEIMVSTDNEEIAELCISQGVKVPFKRSKKNSNDFATTADLVDEVLMDYEKLDFFFDLTCCVYATSALLQESDLINGFKKINNNKYDSIIPITEFTYPVQRSLKIKDDIVNFQNKKYALSRSQDLKKMYHDAGMWYWLNTKKFLKNKKLITNRTGFVEIPPSRVQDIDNHHDWDLAEIKMRKIMGL